MIPSDTIGTLSVLNINDGDTKFSFDSSNPQDVERAKQCIQDMLKRGYILFVSVGEEPNGKLKRVKRFNPKTCEYIISEIQEQTAPDIKGKKNAGKSRAIDAKKHRATAVPRTAGG